MSRVQTQDDQSRSLLNRAKLRSQQREPTPPTTPPTPLQNENPTPLQNKQRGGLVGTPVLILVTEFCERLAYYGIIATIPSLFTTRFHLSNVTTTTVTSLFSLMSYLTAILGAYVADGVLGRYHTILLFCVVYLIGLLMCGVAVWPSLQDSCQPLFFVGLFCFVVVGAGGIKPNVVCFGADQFSTGEGVQPQKDSFFRWFYWSVNLGAGFSYLVLGNIGINGIWIIPPEYGYSAAFSVVVVAVCCGIGLFMLGRNRYVRVPPAGDSLVSFFQALWKLRNRTLQGTVVVWSLILLVPGTLIMVSGFFVKAEWMPIVSGCGISIIGFSVVSFVLFARTTPWVIAQQSSAISESTAENIGAIVRILPYFGLLILFSAIYGQTGTNFAVQGCQMDTRTNRQTNYQLNSTMIHVFDPIAVFIFVPLLDRIILPLLARFGLRPTTMQKIGLGFVASLLAMVCASYVEIKRKESDLLIYSYATMPEQDRNDFVCVLDNHGTDMVNCTEFMTEHGCHCRQIGSVSYLTGCTSQPMSSLSIFYQAPQFVLVGVSEVFSATSAYELFYNQVPGNMKSVCQSLNLLAVSLGTGISGGVNALLSFWMANNLNDARLELIFSTLAVAMFVNLAVFVVTARGFRPRVTQTELGDVTTLLDAES